MLPRPRSRFRYVHALVLAAVSLCACSEEPADPPSGPTSQSAVSALAVPTYSPLVGDFDGEGHSDIAIYDNPNARALLDATTDGRIDGITPQLGLATDIPFMGDWDGDGVETLALYRKGANPQVIWTNNNKNGVYMTRGAVGGTTAIRGDWNGDGKDGFAIYDSATAKFTFYQSMTITGTFANQVYGIVNDIPISGDWNNDSTDGFGIYRPATHQFALVDVVGGPQTNSFTAGPATTGDLPLSGRWHGRTNWSLGLYRPSTKQFLLYNTFSFGPLQMKTWQDPLSVTSTNGRQVFYTDGVPHTNSTGVFRTAYSGAQSFLPIGITYIDTAKTEGNGNIFAQLDSAGFNLAVLWYYFLPNDAIAASSGTNVQLIPRIERFTPALDDSSKVFGWLVYDEPHDDSTRAAMNGFYNTYLSQASRPLFHYNRPPDLNGDVCDNPDPLWTPTAERGDATSVDCYPVTPADPNPSFEPIAQSVTILRGVAHPDVNHPRPLWFIPEAFEDNVRLIPTPLQYRASVYTAFVHGATGLIAFQRDANIARIGGNIGISPAPLTSYPGCTGCASATPDQKTRSKTLWNSMAGLNSELATMKRPLLSPTDTATYNVYLLESPNSGTSPIRTLLKLQGNGDRYLIAVNMINQPLTGVIQLRSVVSSVAVQFESRTVTTPLSAIRDSFGPYAVHIYKF